MNLEYSLEDGKLFFAKDGLLEEYNDISIMYDIEDGVLLKHGKSELVEKYFSNFIKKLLVGKTEKNAHVIDDMIESTRIFKIEKDSIIQNKDMIVDINKCLLTEGYIAKFINKYEK